MTRRDDVAKTPYQRLIESSQIPEVIREELKGICLSLNPAELKRNMDAKLAELYLAHEHSTLLSDAGVKSSWPAMFVQAGT